MVKELGIKSLGFNNEIISDYYKVWNSISHLKKAIGRLPWWPSG